MKGRRRLLHELWGRRRRGVGRRGLCVVGEDWVVVSETVQGPDDDCRRPRVPVWMSRGDPVTTSGPDDPDAYSFAFPPPPLQSENVPDLRFERSRSGSFSGTSEWVSVPEPCLRSRWDGSLLCGLSHRLCRGTPGCGVEGSWAGVGRGEQEEDSGSRSPDPSRLEDGEAPDVTTPDLGPGRLPETFG